MSGIRLISNFGRGTLIIHFSLRGFYWSNLSQKYIKPLVINRSFASSSDGEKDDLGPRRETANQKDVEGKKQAPEEKRKAALNKLNSLLQNMGVGTQAEKQNQSSILLDIAKPVSRRRNFGANEGADPIDQKETEENRKMFGEDVVSAVKEVAESLGGNVKLTENELITKLKESTSNSKGSTDINSLFEGMVIEKVKNRIQFQAKMTPRAKKWMETVNETVTERGEEAKPEWMSQRRKHQYGMLGTSGFPLRVNLESGKPLNIFSNKTIKDKSVQSPLRLWKTFEQREFELLSMRSPQNAFEEMILWTKQGKLWKFPIDNEQGMDEEKQTGFHEHVFLEHHLSKGFPEKGPIRNFMELVCIGLSKNPLLSVKQKTAHINWFREYFKEKEQLLTEIGAL